MPKALSFIRIILLESDCVWISLDFGILYKLKIVHVTQAYIIAAILYNDDCVQNFIKYLMTQKKIANNSVFDTG